MVQLYADSPFNLQDLQFAYDDCSEQIKMQAFHQTDNILF